MFILITSFLFSVWNNISDYCKSHQQYSEIYFLISNHRFNLCMNDFLTGYLLICDARIFRAHHRPNPDGLHINTIEDVVYMGVLVAISIPIFTSQLEKAREATDIANLRSAYAEVSADLLTNDASNMSKTVQATQTVGNWQTNNGSVNIGGITNVPAVTKNGSWNVHVGMNNNVAEVQITSSASNTN